MNMKILSVFLVFLANDCHSKTRLRFMTVKCGASLRTAIKPYCFIKAYTRKNSLINFGFTLLKKVPDGSLYASIEYKTGSGSYNMLISHSNIPICKVLEGADTNPYIKLLIDTVKEFAGDLMEGCSRSGDFKVSNMTFANSSMMGIFPTGLYKSTYRFFNVLDANIANITYETYNVKK